MTDFANSTRRMLPVWLTTGVLALGMTQQVFAEPLLEMPVGAEPTAHIVNENATRALPIGPWTDGKVPTLALTGAIEDQSWRLPGLGKDTLGLIQGLTRQLADHGYKAFFSCETDTCGGFDFRYETKVLSEPEMHVDLGDFRFLSAIRGSGAEADYVGLLVSRAGDTGFVELSQISPQGSVTLPQALDQPASAPVTAVTPPPGQSLAAQLDDQGSVALDDLSFASGASDLGSGRYASLAELAAYLAAHPERQVILVGHTDASGPLDMNVAVSRKRAESVVARLISVYGVPSAQVSAEGVGYLSPRASNLTDEGRHKNRRVEAVLASTR